MKEISQASESEAGRRKAGGENPWKTLVIPVEDFLFSSILLSIVIT